jgi:hypothetical protein
VSDLEVYNGTLWECGANMGPHVGYFQDGNWAAFASAPSGYVSALRSFDGELWVGGDFDLLPPPKVANGLAAWNGATWRPAFGDGLVTKAGTAWSALDHDGELWVCGQNLSMSRGVFGWSVLRRVNGQWSPVPGLGAGDATTMAEFNGDVFAATLIGDYAPPIRRWTGAAWVSAAIGQGAPVAWDQINSLAVHNSKLWAGGRFGPAGARTGLLSWDGQTWAHPASPPGDVWKLFPLDGHLYAAGRGTGPYLARDDGEWSQVWPVSGGVGVYVLASYDGGLVIGGSFSSVGGVNANSVAAWDGAQWRALGEGFPGGTGPNCGVWALGQEGPYLYASGAQATYGGGTAPFVSRWDGNMWTDASGLGLTSNVRSFFRGSDGFYALGSFEMASGSESPYVAALRQQAPACYANCDCSGAPVLNASDFVCFLSRFAARDSYANCDGSMVSPVLNVMDFSCFLRRFAEGCR